MKKSDLKTGMWVECRGGFKACVMLNTPKGDVLTNKEGHIDIDHNDDMTDKDSFYDGKYDIMKVFEPKSKTSCITGERLTLIWEREPEPIEMTLEEACKKLRETVGKPVKIIL